MADRVIVALEQTKRRKNWKKCTLDSGEVVEVPVELVLRNGLSVGVVLVEERYNALKSASEIARGKEQALRLLSYRARSEQELKQRMRKSGIRQGSAKAVLHNLTRLHLVDDEEFARKFVHDLINRKPAGEFLLKAELQKKGISDTIIDRVIRQAFEEISPVELARRGMEQWVSRHPRLTASVERQQKIAQFLYQRGFSRSIIDEIAGDTSAF